MPFSFSAAMFGSAETGHSVMMPVISGCAERKARTLFLIGRVGAAVEHLVAQINAQTIGKTTATLGQCGLLDGLIDAEEGCNPSPLAHMPAASPASYSGWPTYISAPTSRDCSGVPVFMMMRSISTTAACIHQNTLDSILHPVAKNVVLIAGCVVQKAAL